MKQRTTLNQDKENENNDVGGLENNPLRLNGDVEIKELIASPLSVSTSYFLDFEKEKGRSG